MSKLTENWRVSRMARLLGVMQGRVGEKKERGRVIDIWRGRVDRERGRGRGESGEKRDG